MSTAQDIKDLREEFTGIDRAIVDGAKKHENSSSIIK